MGIKITAEGVETKEQEKFLRQNDCDLYQGYLYCKPLPINEFIEFVNNWKSLPDSIPSK
jgi:sensor c-di-GMP phosphodiesterase-like protein